MALTDSTAKAGNVTLAGTAAADANILFNSEDEGFEPKAIYLANTHSTNALHFSAQPLHSDSGTAIGSSDFGLLAPGDELILAVSDEFFDAQGGITVLWAYGAAASVTCSWAVVSR